MTRTLYCFCRGDTPANKSWFIMKKKKNESWTRVNEIPLVNLGSLFFWTVVFWENIRSLKHRQQHTEILHLELCFWHQSLLTGDQGLLAPKDPPVTYMGWLGWSQPSVQTKKTLLPHIRCKSQSPPAFLAVKPRICQATTEYFLLASRLALRQGSIWKLAWLQQPLPAPWIPARWLGLHVYHQLWNSHNTKCILCISPTPELEPLTSSSIDIRLPLPFGVNIHFCSCSLQMPWLHLADAFH